MLEYLTNWKGLITINNADYNSVSDASKINFDSFSDNVHIVLHSNVEKQSVSDSIEYLVTVKAYMTKKSTADFDFMLKFNNDIPMPFRTMIGNVVKETKGMIYMNLHADIYTDKITTCMKCGKVLTNPVSQYFGVGPECGCHNYVSPFDSIDELNRAISNYRETLRKFTWSGWIIKSSIMDWKEL